MKSYKELTSTQKMELEWGGEFLINTDVEEIIQTISNLGATDILIEGYDEVYDELIVDTTSCDKEQVTEILVYLGQLRPDEIDILRDINPHLIRVWWD